jgi:hypothetical protein
MMNSTLNLIGNPIKISGIKDLLHKYNNFFFDLDGVIVILYLIKVVRVKDYQGRPGGPQPLEKVKQAPLLHYQQQHPKLSGSLRKVHLSRVLGITQRRNSSENLDLHIFLNDCSLS